MMTRAGGALALLVAGLAAGPVHAEQDVEAVVKHRQSVMEALGGHMGALRQILEGKAGAEAMVPVHVAALAALTRDIPTMFPAGSDFAETEATAAVWEKPEEFRQKGQEAQDAAAALQQAAADREARVKAFKALSETCKSCHKTFRND
jgi:cytochrome c556